MATSHHAISHSLVAARRACADPVSRQTRYFDSALEVIRLVVMMYAKVGGEIQWLQPSLPTPSCRPDPDAGGIVKQTPS